MPFLVHDTRAISHRPQFRADLDEQEQLALRRQHKALTNEDRNASIVRQSTISASDAAFQLKMIVTEGYRYQRDFYDRHGQALSLKRRVHPRHYALFNAARVLDVLNDIDVLMTSNPDAVPSWPDPAEDPMREPALPPQYGQAVPTAAQRYRHTANEIALLHIWG